MQYPEVTVGALIFNKEGKLLICKSHKWDNKYVIPGGHIEYGEKIKDALKREILEETNLEVYDIKLLSINENILDNEFHQDKHFIFLDFICKSKSSKVSLNDEAQSFKWVDLEKIEKYNIGNMLKKLIKEIKKGDKSNFKTEIIYGY